MSNISLKMEKKNEISRSFLPEFFLRYLWLCGLYHPSRLATADETRCEKSSSRNCWGRPRAVVGYLIAILTGTFTLVGLADYLYYFEKYITAMNFFVSVRVINYASQVLMTPLIMFIMFYFRKPILHVLDHFCRVGTALLNDKTWRKFRQHVSIFVPIWILTWLAVFCIFASFRYWSFITAPLESGWGHATKVLEKPGLIFNLPVSILDVIIFTRSYYIAAINAEMASQLLYIILIFALGTLFEIVHQNIQTAAAEHTVPKCMRNERLSRTLSEQFKNLRVLQNLTHDLNDTFGFVILLNCIRDIICVIGVIAALLEVIDPQRINETRVDYAERLEGAVRQRYWDLTTISITLANAALRIGVCLHCSANVQKIVRLVQTIRLECPEPEIQTKCVMILSEIDASTGAVSAAGIRTINLEYVAHVVGIWITYGILIYQTRDEKVGEVDVANAQDLHQGMSVLKETLRNESASLEQLIRQRLNQSA